MPKTLTNSEHHLEQTKEMSRARQIELAKGILRGQGDKCAKCGEPLKYEDATKNSHSFEIICQKCYNDPPDKPLIIIDDYSPSPDSRLEEILTEVRTVLEGLRTGMFNKPDCWCGPFDSHHGYELYLGAGNTLCAKHSEACLAAQALMKRLEVR